jgi:hypothetical protein
MSIPDEYCDQLDELLSLCNSSSLVVVEAINIETEKICYILCGTHCEADSDEIMLVPFGEFLLTEEITQRFRLREKGELIEADDERAYGNYTLPKPTTKKDYTN